MCAQLFITFSHIPLATVNAPTQSQGRLENVVCVLRKETKELMNFSQSLSKEKGRTYRCRLSFISRYTCETMHVESSSHTSLKQEARE
jgi:hypothetical protein